MPDLLNLVGMVGNQNLASALDLLDLYLVQIWSFLSVCSLVNYNAIPVVLFFFSCCDNGGSYVTSRKNGRGNW